MGVQVIAGLRVGLVIFIVANGIHFSASAGFLDAWHDTIPRGKTLGGIAYGNGKLVAVGGDGELLTSTNSVDWQRGVVPSVRFISDVTYGKGLFLAVGSITNQSGVVMISTNATDWTTNVVGPSRLDGCAFGKGIFVVAGHNTLLSSPDAIHWTSRKPNLILSFYGVDFIDDHFVAVGNFGLTMTSSNAIVWSAPTTDGLPGLNASAYGNGTTVMVGEHDRIKTICPTNSADSAEGYDIRLSDIAFENGRFVAVGDVIGLGVIYTSTDGFSWQHPIFGETSTLERVAFANGEFIAVGGNGTVLTSTNGMNWTLRRGGVPAPLWSVATAKDSVLAVGGFYNTVGTLLSSTGDLSWQNQHWDGNNYPLRILYANNKFLAVGSGGIVSISSDGTTWTHRASPVSNWLNDVIYAQGVYVAVGDSGQIERSADGITWTNHSVDPAKYLYGVAYGMGRFVAVGYTGVVLSSQDGATWADGTTGVSKWLHAVSFGKDAFVAVGDAGTILRSTNGQTWVIQQTPSTNALWGVRYVADRFIALGTSGTILSSFDGITWQQHTSGVAETLYDAVLAKNRVWVVGDFGTALVSKHEAYPILQTGSLRSGVGFELTLATDLGRPCRVQASSDLVTWQDLGVIESSGTNRAYLDCTATNQPMRFYRTVAE